MSSGIPHITATWNNFITRMDVSCPHRQLIPIFTGFLEDQSFRRRWMRSRYRSSPVIAYARPRTVSQSKRDNSQRFLISPVFRSRSEEHTSELQSRGHLVCRLLLEKKKVE